MTSMTTNSSAVTGGVDTHGQTHHGAALDSVGRQLGDREFPTTPAGYRALVNWRQGFGHLERVGVEGAGAYGAGLTRQLRAAGSPWSRLTTPTVRLAEPKESPTSWTPIRQRAPRWQGKPPECRKTQDGRVEAVRTATAMSTAA